MKKFLKVLLSGFTTMLWGIGGMTAFLIAIENIQNISGSIGWIAIVRFVIALVCIITCIIILMVLGELTKRKKKVYSK